MRVLTLLCAALLAPAALAQSAPYVQLMLDGQTATGTTTHDQGWVRFLPDAEMGWDIHDGSKYMPPLATYSIFALQGERAGQPHYLAVSSLPDGSNVPLGRRVDVRVDHQSTEAGTFTFTWDESHFPRGWKAFLIDRQTGAKIKMWRSDAYTFTTDATTWNNRFILRFRPPRNAQAAPLAAEPEAMPALTTAALAVSAPAPNPTRGDARITVSVGENGPVHVAVYDALGRETASLAPRDLGPGSHTLDLPMDGLPPGAYVVRVWTDHEARTHRLSLVR